ncbi:hypothetical protein DFH08DRAFT_979135 [Mycena albidolilacea]|nr:hypothetical protein DFH08DRAFT_979135 [Mycena albidolilacea]
MEAHRDLQITGLTPDPNPTLLAVQAKPTPAAEPTPYRPPGPLKGIGLHRYTFTHYCHTFGGPLNITPPPQGDGTAMWLNFGSGTG